MNNWNRVLCLILHMTLIFSIGGISMANAFLHDIASALGQTSSNYPGNNVPYRIGQNNNFGQRPAYQTIDRVGRTYRLPNINRQYMGYKSFGSAMQNPTRRHKIGASTRRCFCLGSPPSTLLERLFGMRSYTSAKPRLSKNRRIKPVSRSKSVSYYDPRAQLKRYPKTLKRRLQGGTAMRITHGQMLPYSGSMQLRCWNRMRPSRSTYRGMKRKHRKIHYKGMKISRSIHQRQRHISWKKAHSKLLRHLRRMQAKHRHRCRCTVKCRCKRLKHGKSKKTLKKHVVPINRMKHYKSSKSKPGKTIKESHLKKHKKHRIHRKKKPRKHKQKIIKRVERKHKTSKKSTNNFKKWSSKSYKVPITRQNPILIQAPRCPIRHYHYHFYRYSPRQSLQRQNASNQFLRRISHRFHYKRKAGSPFRKRMYLRRNWQAPKSSRLPAYKRQRPYARWTTPRTRYVYDTTRRSRMSWPGRYGHSRRLGTGLSYQKAYRSGYIRGCSMCRRRYAYDHNRYNTPYGRVRYANFMNKGLSSSANIRRKRHMSPSWYRSSPGSYDESRGVGCGFGGRVRKYAPYMFYHQRFPTSMSSFNPSIYNNQLFNRYSMNGDLHNNILGYQYHSPMMSSFIQGAGSSPSYQSYYCMNRPYQYPSYNPLYTGVGMHSMNMPMTNVQQTFGTQPASYLQRAANFIHGIFGTGQHHIDSQAACTCPKNPTIVIHTGSNPQISSGSTTRVIHGTTGSNVCTKPQTSTNIAHPLQELARLTEDINRVQHTTLQPLIQRNHQLAMQRDSSLCKVIH